MALTIDEIRKGIAAGRLSATAVAESALAAIESQEPALHAYLALCRERALAQAANIDALARRGDALPALAGVPVAVKDVLSTRGVRTSCGSRVLENYLPVYDATAVRRLEEAGAVVVGKTNCDEFAMGSSTENSAYGPTHNPWSLERVPGGSSGGSAATVAAGAVPAALGSDTGGSIRQPAAFCGVVGLLPTYGRVSRYGLVAFASSLDHVGPLTANTRDAAHILQAIAGRDALDSTSAAEPVPDYLAGLGNGESRPLAGVKLGVAREILTEGVHPGVEAAVQNAIAALAAAGCEIVPVSLPHSASAIAIYYLIATAEASSNLARYDGVRYGMRVAADNLGEMYRRTRGAGFGAEVKRRILLGTYALSAGYYDAYYRKAQQVRSLLTGEFHAALAQVDAIVSPTTPTPAFRIGEKAADPLALYLADIFTVPADLTGLPAISVPCGLCDGLPVGLQLIGRSFDEATLLRIAEGYERMAPALPRPGLTA